MTYENHAAKVQILRPLYLTLNNSTFNILLRINHDEITSKRLINAMERFNGLTSDETKMTREHIRPVETEFLTASRILLKAEWRRVKSGEWTFRCAKFLALAVVLSSMTLGGWAAYTMIRPGSLATASATASEAHPKIEDDANRPSDRGTDNATGTR